MLDCTQLQCTQMLACVKRDSGSKQHLLSHGLEVESRQQNVTIERDSAISAVCPCSMHWLLSSSRVGLCWATP